VRLTTNSQNLTSKKTTQTKQVLELTWNHGDELKAKDGNGKGVYHTGLTAPFGFAATGMTCDDMDALATTLTAAEVTPAIRVRAPQQKEAACGSSARERMTILDPGK
jgi:hypothetical protein